MLTFGLIINPFAGVGGAVGLKGSDGDAVVAEAFARGAEQRSGARTEQALQALIPYRDRCRFITCADDMGAKVLEKLGFDYQILPVAMTQPTSAEQTREAAKLMLLAKPDVLVFAGGDGTARDICIVIGEQLPVLGIPAGVKIHSGVYGVTPVASGEVLRHLLEGRLVDIREAEVRDLDEDAFRQNQVRAKHYGDMRVPQAGHFVQAVKQGGVEDESLVVADIAADVINLMDDDVVYFIGSGKTTLAIMDELGLNNTLLGVDAVLNRKLIAQDINEQQIWALMQEYSHRKAVVSIMGGQGHVFGRGNQQFSPRILRALGKLNILLASTKTKITALNGRPLIIDSGDATLDQEWHGTVEVITGYNDRIVYPIA